MADTAVQDPGAGETGNLKLLAEYCRGFRGADAKRSILQLATTAALFLGTLSADIAAYRHAHYWICALLVLPLAGFLVRLFIIQHDCGHGSFFADRRANDVTGRIISIFTFIPYDMWRRSHNAHHATSGNLGNRGAGDIDTLTVREYMALPKIEKLYYRFYRHPLILLVLGPPVYILFLLRFPPSQSVSYMKDYHPMPVKTAWRSAMTLNVFLAIFYGSVGAFFGWETVLILYLPIVIVAFWIGQFLFFVQHQFEDTYWQRGKAWSYAEAAVHGSSYYEMPRILQWFTGNIGFHHIHHLCPAIPNYRLQECFEGNRELTKARRITLLSSLRCITLALWDEDAGRMIRFRDLKQA